MPEKDARVIFVTLDRAGIHEPIKGEGMLKELLCRFPMEEIWIGSAEEYPCLAVQTNGERACLTYFHEEGLMWQSHGTASEGTAFYAGGELWEAPADAVISRSEAVMCAVDFYRTQSRPGCIQWQQL